MMSIVSSFYSKKQVSTQHKQTYITHKVVASVLVLCCGSIFLYAPAITIHIPSGITRLKKMVLLPKFSLLLWVLLSSYVILLINNPVKCDDGEYLLILNFVMA
jgi:small-conductance mechanosensitive channel